jgi:hypothetical protein
MEARMVDEQMEDEASRKAMLSIAEEYDRIVARASVRLKDSDRDR